LHREIQHFKLKYRVSRLRAVRATFPGADPAHELPHANVKHQ
jgi:hypothetical protein